jgi:hypothetical protein
LELFEFLFIFEDSDVVEFAVILVSLCIVVVVDDIFVVTDIVLCVEVHVIVPCVVIKLLMSTHFDELFV